MSLAADFHALHAGPGVLLLPNGWDAASCRLLQEAGAKAVATSSAAVAWAHGYPDGDRLPADLLVRTVDEVARVVSMPLSVDMESGYSDDPAQVAQTAARLIGAGAVGINIEDRAEAPDLLARKIEAIRAAAVREGVDLFINARADLYIYGAPAGADTVAKMLRRAALYAAAGADGLFAVGVSAPTDIAAIAAGTSLPVNVMSFAGIPAAAELQRLGARRLSASTGMARAAWTTLSAVAADWLKAGDNDALARAGDAAVNYNVLFAG